MTTTTASAAGPCTLAQSQDYCRTLTRQQARNFYYGLKLLPEPKRTAMYALYGYMRLVDDIADNDAQRRTVVQRRADLDAWEAQTHQAEAAARGGGELPTGNPVWPAFVEMQRQYQVPAKVFADMIAGQRQDLEPVSMPDFAALHDYCYRVASVVGVASLYVFQFEGGDETLQLGVDRGIAFQLTNILRDLREDAGPPRGRCYLPADDMGRFGVTARALAEGRAEPGFCDLMQFQVRRAREYYERSAALESRVHADARPTLAAMTAIYRGILEKIAARPEAVLQGRVRLSQWTKLSIGWRALRG
jgi:15-cis-phytoene synthase